MPSLISEWMEDGTMTEYMKTFPRCCNETQRMVRSSSLLPGVRSNKSPKLLGIASGLAYLHGTHVIHADLKSVCCSLLPFIFWSESLSAVV